MPRWNGGVIGAANNPTSSSAKGIWSLSEATKAIRSGLWPPSNAGADPYFENVTLLLPGDGTNGAQNNTFLDSSTNNFTITRNGNTTQGTFSPFSKVDGRWAAFTNGSTQDVLITDNSAFQPGSGDFTYEAWVYPLSLPSASNYKTFWAQRSSASANGGVCPVVDSSGNLLLFVANSTASSWQLTGASTGITISTNQWQHIAITRSGNTITPYKNGTAGTTSSVSTGAIGTSAGLSLMAGSYDGAQLVDGYMSNFRMVKGTAITPPAGGPTAPLSAVSGTGVLTLQSNRFIDNSGNNQTVTPVGGAQITTFSPFPTLTAYAAGTNGGSAYFDGTGDYLTVANNTALNLESGDFTVECWFYAVDTTSAKPLIVRFNGNTTARTDLQYYIRINAGSLEIIPYQSTTDYAMSFSNLTANAWHHCALVRTGNNFYAYLDGVRNATTRTITGSLNNNTWETWVGGYREGGTFSYQNGYISSVRVVKGTALYTEATYTVPTTPFTAITNTSLLLSGTNGGIIDTSMSNDLETVGNAQISTTQSKFGGASMSFDGTGDWLAIPAGDKFAFGSGDYTVEAWIYFNSITNTDLQIIFMSGSTGGNTFYFHADGNQLSVGTASVLVSNQSTTFNTGTWYHVAACRSGTTLRLFVNGTQIGSNATDSTSWISSGTARVGSNESGGQTVNGYIDDLRVTKGYARYTSNFTAPTAPFNGFGD